MTSRVGSLLVAGFLGAIALVAVVVIIILTDPGEAPDSAVIVASLRDDQVVLLGDPTEIRVTVTDDEPITRIALFVDGEPITADAQPVHDPAQGTYSASIPWLPGRLGFVTISVTAQGLSGDESLIELRVEVTDDASRLGGALTVSATRTSAGAPIVNEPLRLQARARSQEAIVVRFRLEVGGTPVAESGAVESEPGVYDGILEWTPTQAGTVAAEVFAETTDGTQVRTELLLDVLGADVAVAATAQAQAAPPARTETAPAAPADEGFLSIQTPADGAGFGWTDDLEVEIVVFADGVGTLVGMTLFVDTVPVSNVDGLQALGDGAYSLAIPWEPSGEGTFILEVVAISNTNRRYDDRVTVTVDPAEEDEEDEEDDPEEDIEEDPEADDAGAEEEEDAEDVDEQPTVDLTPTAIDVGTGQSVVVTITNAGEGNLANTPILVSLTRSSDGLVLDEATVVLTLPADRSQVVELPISLTDSLEITVVVDRDNTIPESDESNNTISATFDPPLRPDLVLQALQLQPDRTVFVRVTNIGGSAAAPPIVVLIVLDGLIVEELSYGGPGPLTPQGTLDLPGSVLIGEGQSLSAIVDPANGIAESNDGNNAITVSIAP